MDHAEQIAAQAVDAANPQDAALRQEDRAHSGGTMSACSGRSAKAKAALAGIVLLTRH
jgi:hypothetical protein